MPNTSQSVSGWDAVEFVEALILRLAIGLGAKVPFAEDRRGVAGVMEHLGHGDLVRRQGYRCAGDRNQRQPGADRIASFIKAARDGVQEGSTRNWVSLRPSAAN